MKKPRKEAAEPVRWAVWLYRRRATRLGSVDAKNREEALKKASETFEIEPADQFRISVARE
jgi:hypothetical protein